MFPKAHIWTLDMTLLFPGSKDIKLYIHTTNSHIYIPILKHRNIYCILHGFFVC
jgi:hypothetical protein